MGCCHGVCHVCCCAGSCSKPEPPASRGPNLFAFFFQLAFILSVGLIGLFFLLFIICIIWNCCEDPSPPPAKVFRHIRKEAEKRGYDVISAKNQVTVLIDDYGEVGFGLGDTDEWVKITMISPDPHRRYPNEIQSFKAYLTVEANQILRVAIRASGGFETKCKTSPIWCWPCRWLPIPVL